MARDKRLAQFSEQRVESFDEEANGPEFMAYGSDPATEPRIEGDPEYSMPLFPSADGETSGPRSRLLKMARHFNWPDPIVRSRVVRFGIFAVSAAVIAFTLVSLEQSYDLFAKAKASLFGVPTEQADATDQDDGSQLASGGAALSTAPSTVGVRTGSASARGNPSRDDIAHALNTARPVNDPAQPLAAAPGARNISPEDLASLMKRAKGLLAIGDIMPARLLLERAAQDANAALLLAQTYDPVVLGKQDTRTITPDPAVARSWYERAAALGSQNAKQRLTQMQN